MLLRKDHRKAFTIYFSFIIGIMLVVVPLFSSALNALEKRTVQSSRETLTYGLQQLDEELNSTYQMCQILNSDQNLYTLSLISQNILDPGPGKVPAIQKVKQTYEYLFRMLNLVEDVGIVLPNRVIVADGRIHMPVEPFWGTYLYAEGIYSLSDWLEFIHATDGTHSFNSLLLKRYDKGAEHRMVFSFPITITRSEGTYCYAILAEDAVLRTLVQSDLLQNSYLTLTWDNRMLIDHAPESTPKSTVSIEAVSSHYKLTARLDIDRAFFTHQLQDFYYISIIFLAVYLIFGLVMALIYSRHTIAPLTQTVKAIREVTQSPYLQEDYKDSYAYINHFIETTDNLLKENKLALANQEMLIKENLMERVLRGLVFHNSPSELIGKSFPDFPMPCIMCVIQFAKCEALTSQQFASLQVKARHIAENSLRGRIVLHFSADLLVVMRDASESTPDVNQALCEHFENEMDLNVRMCVSQPFFTPDALSPVFMRLRQLLRVTDISQTLLYEDSQIVLQPYLNLHYTSRFFEFLMRSQLEAALSLLDEECSVFKSNRPITETDLQQFFYCYRHVLCQVITASAIPSDEITMPKYDSNASLNDLMCGIRTCAATICAAQINRRSIQIDQREKEILRAINSELGNPNLNIEVIMEIFGISNRALQNLMRQATGTTFMDYVNTKRMERSKQLLCTTNMSIQDVSSACGYASVNTFYKAFQRTYSITPKAMRDGVPSK